MRRQSLRIPLLAQPGPRQGRKELANLSRRWETFAAVKGATATLKVTTTVDS